MAPEATAGEYLRADPPNNNSASAESVNTYVSSDASVHETTTEPRVEVVEERREVIPSNAIPSTPPSFGNLFPSSRRLMVRHDDTTLDGNMNLRVTTLAAESPGRQDETILFHLRMYDLHDKKFSLRRYCRDSRREVCHSLRKPQMPKLRPGSSGHKHMSNPISGLLSHAGAGTRPSKGLRRPDSGYKSGLDDDEPIGSGKYAGSTYSANRPPFVNVIQLEFSNYAHVELKRRGSVSSRRYEFEYWDAKYQWKKVTRNDGASKEVSYHLYHQATSNPVAHIIPEPLTPRELSVEVRKGAWVPSSSMWINDPTLYEKMKDVADVIVATGLVAFVDDCIERRWHSKRTSHHASPMASSFMRSVESVTSTKFIDKVFHRRSSTGSNNAGSLREMLKSISQGTAY
ncbi:hypothetical protein MGYG_08234 [Nannizzia gypsea CBS 118893]|uniref:Uncharacterized protein n=1 Tax=Arthroderma gypseum (strain ATCC MYA-4604 / CBS 118893) TaxID=535722 RepID=E4V638_ARTGP|nr:hypothetical protein MGYG_08234 [Nannizzia gypsea CBS 118893]EFR05221.1 hypothetical protein MGYG_08234 [Nannizzia gypsea CBS 118893]